MTTPPADDREDSPSAGGGPAAFVALPLLMVAGLALRAWPVATRPLWHDEVMTWRFTVDASWWEVLTWRQHYEHPPLSYLLVKAAIAAFGSDAEWVLRLPALACGVLAIPAGYLLGRLLHGRWLGVLVAGLIAFDFNQIIQSQQARMYTLTVLCVLLTLGALVWALRKAGRGKSEERRETRDGSSIALPSSLFALPSSLFALPSSLPAWFAVGAGLAASFAASNIGLILWAALPLGLVGAGIAARIQSPASRVQSPESQTHRLPHETRDAGRWTLDAWLGLLVAYAAAVAWCSMGIVVMLSPERLGWFADKSGATPAGLRFAGLLSDIGHAYGSLPVALGAVTAGAAGVLLLSRRRPAAAMVLLALAAVNLLFALPVQPHGFEPRPRYVILMQIPVWVGLAYLVVAARPRAVRAAALAGVAALSAWTAWHSLGHGEQWRYRFGDAIQLVAPRVQPGDAVVFYPAWVDDLPTYYGMEPTHQPPAWGGASWRDWLLPFDTLPTDRPTWLVIAYHHETGATDAAPDMIHAVAERYGVTIDRATARAMVVRQPVVIARIDGRGVMYVDLSAALGAAEPRRETRSSQYTDSGK